MKTVIDIHCKCQAFNGKIGNTHFESLSQNGLVHFILICHTGTAQVK